MAVLWHDELDSTNAEVLRSCSGLDNLSVVAARYQTAGRGQRGNSWHSARGENLTFTVLVRSKSLFPDGNFTALNWVCALAARDFIRGEGAGSAVIKWPNDIYAGMRKICGILVENRLADASGETFSACGFGINLNQTVFPSGLINPTSVRCLTGRYREPEAALERFMAHFRTQYERLAGPLDALKSDYEDGLFQKDILRPYRDLRTGAVFEGIIRGVSPDGRLQVEQKTDTLPNAGRVSALYGFKEIGYIL